MIPSLGYDEVILEGASPGNLAFGPARMLLEVAERYGKPIFLSETGAEGTAKPSWLHYVCSEVRSAMRRL